MGGAPELLRPRHRARLSLGLRAQVRHAHLIIGHAHFPTDHAHFLIGHAHYTQATPTPLNFALCWYREV